LSNTKIAPDLYRDAMARYAGHVQIATAEHEGVRRGVTVTAACSVSDNPATVLVCVAKDNPANRVFIDAGAFALNTLAARHQPLADVFSGLVPMEGAKRFEQGVWDHLETGAPTLADAPVVYDCKLVEAKDVATHMVLFGEVQAVRLGDSAPALVYMNRSYHTV
jgi:cob(II)yrinic acid a,c-diamide reductase